MSRTPDDAQIARMELEADELRQRLRDTKCKYCGEPLRRPSELRFDSHDECHAEPA